MRNNPPLSESNDAVGKDSPPDSGSPHSGAHSLIQYASSSPSFTKGSSSTAASAAPGSFVSNVISPPVRSANGPPQVAAQRESAPMGDVIGHGLAHTLWLVPHQVEVHVPRTHLPPPQPTPALDSTEPAAQVTGPHQRPDAAQCSRPQVEFRVSAAYFGVSAWAF
jgi:hypothetical protein